METIVGNSAGFCYGVKRAVEGAENILKKVKPSTVYCLGEIVHNKEVTENLEKNGLQFIESPSQAKDTTIIRAHGVSKHVYTALSAHHVNIIDYTCPNVLKIHQIAEEYSHNGYFIFLIGDRKHPENIGTISSCGSNSFIIENELDIQEAIHTFRATTLDKLLILAQTTFSIDKFDAITTKIKYALSSNEKLVIRNTICNATEIRQKETASIAQKVEYMIIIGGKNSSNTQKLYEIAKLNCKNSICIENAKELPLEEISAYQKVGIMAGASTPQNSIDTVISLLKK